MTRNRSRRGRKQVNAAAGHTRPAQWAAKEALRVHHKELMKLPLQDLLPELYGDGLVTEETQERIAHPRAVLIKKEANHLVLQDVRVAVSNRPECLDRFLKGLQTLQPAVGLSQRIGDTYAAKCASTPPASVLRSGHRRAQCIKWAHNTAMLAGVIAFLCTFAYIFGGYLPQVAEMQRTGLPQEPDYFVNREQEQEKIMQSVTGGISRRSRIITITGSPGYGKTTLANVCGHRFVAQGIPVRYVDLQHVRTIKGIVVKILDAIGSTVSDPSLEQLRRWAGHRQNGMLVFVLDNVDCFTLSGEGLKEEFSDLIKDFIVKPSQAIHVILTTQYQLGYIDSFQLIALDRLSEAHAQELLLHRNPSLTSNVTSTLANFTDGNPLALQILSALLHMPNAPPISTLLRQLQYNPVKALSPDNVHEKLNHVFKVAIGYLSQADHQCFLVVCQFPGSFNEALASAVLPHFVNETVPTCLGHLLARSLLEYNRNTGRYAVLPLLKTFVNSKEENYSIMAAQFFPVYVQYLLQTATKKQLLSEVHLQNYLKANYVGMQYLIDKYISWSIDVDTNVDLILPFALSTFNILPLLQPLNVVEEFWFSLQNLTWNITSEGFEGHCHECLEQAIEFESLLADYVLSTGRNNTVVTARLFCRAQKLQSVQVDKLQSLTVSNCIRTVALLRYLGLVTKYSHSEAMYQNLVKAIMHLASSSNHSTADADYSVGEIYFEMKEYKLALEFLNRSLTSNPGNLKAAKTMVLAFQRSGQNELAVDSAITQFSNLLNQTSLNFSTLNFNSDYVTFTQTATEILEEIADIYRTFMELFVTLNETGLFTELLLNYKLPNISMSTTMQYYSKHCFGEPSGVSGELHEMIRFLECLNMDPKVTRDSLAYIQFQLYLIRVQGDLLTGYMTHARNMKVRLGKAKLVTVRHGWEQDYSKQVIDVLGSFLDWELNLKKKNVCREFKTDSAICHMVRRQVRLLWQLQYELADSIAAFSDDFDMPKQAKEYTEIALEKLPKSSVKKKWKVMVDLKLNLAKIELSLGNYWNAIYILRNCSLTIDEPMIDNVYKATQSSSTWLSHDVSFPDGQFSVLVYQFFHVFNASKVLSAVVSGTVSLIVRADFGITVSHLLFVAIVVILFSLVFTISLMLGSALYCLQCIYSCCSDRHKCQWDKFRLFFFNLIIVMFAFSHIVVFYSYVLHFHTTVLLTYLNYI